MPRCASSLQTLFSNLYFVPSGCFLKISARSPMLCGVFNLRTSLSYSDVVLCGCFLKIVSIKMDNGNGDGIIEDEESDLMSSIMLRDDSTNAGLLKAYRHFMRRILWKKQEKPPQSVPVSLEENVCVDGSCRCYEKCPVCMQILASGDGKRIVITSDKGVQVDFNSSITQQNLDLNDIRIPEIVYNTPKKLEKSRKSESPFKADKRINKAVRMIKSEEIQPARSLDQLHCEYVKLLILNNWHKFDDHFRQKFANSVCTAPLLTKDELILCQKTFKSHHQAEQLQRIYLAKVYHISDRKSTTRKCM